MTGEAAAAPKDEEEAKAAASVVEAASIEEAEAVPADEEAMARHDIQCSTLLFFIRGKQASERFWGGTPTPSARPPTLTNTTTSS